MSAPELIRDELTRAARELGAPDSVAPVLERPRDPAFGEWTTNLAMTLAKPLRRKPQEIATDLIGRMDLHRATVSEEDWQRFLNVEVTPRFPDGLTVYDVYGQYRGSDGLHLWSRRFGGTGSERCQALAVDGGGAVVSGYFSGTTNFGDGARTSAGMNDLFLFTLLP